MKRELEKIMIEDVEFAYYHRVKNNVYNFYGSNHLRYT